MIQDSTPWYLSKENKNTNLKRRMYPHAHCSIIYNSQDMETTEVSIEDEWIKKLWYTHTLNEILFSHKKQWNLAICDNMDRPQEHYAKGNKSDRERQTLHDLSYMWNLKQQ